jgi:phage baseplate assembly protein W
MYPSYGCGIKTHVFDSVSESMLTILKDMVEKAILFFEPRITVNTINIDTSEVNDGKLLINIIYTIRTTNNRSNMVYPYYFIEGTSIKH